MSVHRIKKGLDVPLAGEPVQEIESAPQPGSVAIVAADYVGMRPTMHVSPGDTVKRGQLLFEDKKTPGLRYTSLAAGTVTAVNRGERRALQSVVVALSDRERGGNAASDDMTEFESFWGEGADPTGDQIKALLIESGMWTAFRTRPFSKVPAPDSEPRAIFVTAIDTNPLAASPEVVLKGREDDFQLGLACVAKLCQGKTFLCKATGADIPCPSDSGVIVEEFEGPHPAGAVGLHIHMLSPVGPEKVVWHVGYQDVAAIGKLCATGALDVERVISLAGPQVKRPRLVATRIGASLDDLTADELAGGESRVISGSVLSGRTAMGEIHGYLGRRHTQVSVIEEGREREFLGWIMPGAKKYSFGRTFLSWLIPNGTYDLTTSLNGGGRAMVPIGLYERVMPMDIIPTFLLRSILAGDIERSEQLGCLELDEEDLALCTFVCPCKIEYGPALRSILNTIEKEG